MSRALSLLLPLFFATSAIAVADEVPSPSTEPPGRAGRISVIDGRLSLHMSGEETWSEAETNFPITADMEFVTDAGTRTELQLGGMTVAVAGRTAVTVVALDDDATHLFLDEGSIDLRVHALGRTEKLIVETPDGSVTVQDSGIYRIDTSDRANPMCVAVFDGSADVETRLGQQGLSAGQALLVAEDGQVQPTHPEIAALDEWAQARDTEGGTNSSAQYVSSDLPGYEDLDRAGTWQTTKDYGALWFPSKVSADWAPYQNGHWTWIAPWGWTWIDRDAWGFAPFHYGRWINVDGRWGWTPGKRLRHPVYAPALVGFDGVDPATFASENQPPRRWVALGPGEIYRAPYSQDLDYLRKVNKGAVPNDQLAAATWDSDEWPAFVNIGHVHIDHLSLPPKVADIAPGTAPEQGSPQAASSEPTNETLPLDSDGQPQMVLHIPMDEARRLNLVPDDANDTPRQKNDRLEQPTSADEQQNPERPQQQAEHIKGVPDNLTHPELADRSGLLDPLPDGDSPAPPPVHQEKLEVLRPAAPSQPPLAWPVHQQTARKHDAPATGSATPRTQSQPASQQQKVEPKVIPASDDSDDD